MKTLAEYEVGTTIPSTQTLQKIEKALGSVFLF